MVSIAYLFEGKIKEHFKKHKGKYALGAAAAGLYYSDDITPRPLKNFIRSKVTGTETIHNSDDLLKGYENHPKYRELKDIADKADPEDLERITKFGIHNKHNLPIPPELKLPPGATRDNVGGYHKYKPVFSNFRDREIRLRDDMPNMPIEKAFKHELGHHIDSEKDTFSKAIQDTNKPYAGQKTEYVARKFAKEHATSGLSYKQFIKNAREEADKMSEDQRANYEPPMRNTGSSEDFQKKINEFRKRHYK